MLDVVQNRLCHISWSRSEHKNLAARIQSFETSNLAGLGESTTLILYLSFWGGRLAMLFEGQKKAAGRVVWLHFSLAAILLKFIGEFSSFLSFRAPQHIPNFTVQPRT